MFLDMLRNLRNRTQEIQRLIGRSLRSVVDLKSIGDNTILIDCDVIQADGGTRTAAISGSCIALADALTCLQKKRLVKNICGLASEPEVSQAYDIAIF